MQPAVRPAPAELKVSLRERLAAPATPIPVAPPLLLPRELPRNASAIVAVSAPRLAGTSPVPDIPARLSGEAALKAAEQLRRELPYPREAIERGLEGEALVLLFLDASGTVIAARLEASSGHALLDDAAVRAARSLHSLPDSAPREALLPVRFRLR
jgi:protein TonB